MSWFAAHQAFSLQAVNWTLCEQKEPGVFVCVCPNLTSGLKGGSSMLASSRLKLIFLKIGCCFTSIAPRPWQPRRSLGSLARSWWTEGGRRWRRRRRKINQKYKTVYFYRCVLSSNFPTTSTTAAPLSRESLNLLNLRSECSITSHSHNRSVPLLTLTHTVCLILGAVDFEDDSGVGCTVRWSKTELRRVFFCRSVCKPNISALFFTFSYSDGYKTQLSNLLFCAEQRKWSQPKCLIIFAKYRL